jgi:hypothetical protein
VQIIYCVASQVQMTSEFNKVDNLGVSYMARAWLDIKQRQALKAQTKSNAVKRLVAHFERESTQDEWDILFCGPADGKEAGYRGQDQANCLISEDGKRLIFSGVLPSSLAPRAARRWQVCHQRVPRHCSWQC